MKQSTAAIDELAAKYAAVDFLKNSARKPFAGKRKTAADHEDLTAKINEKLLEEKILDRELLPREIKRITDIQATEGFEPDRLLPGYTILYLETYDFLGAHLGDRAGLLARNFEKPLSRIFPRSGATFFLVLKKGE